MDIGMIGDRLSVLRKEKRLTQSQAAEAIGIGLRFYQAIEGNEKAPSFETLISISEAFGASIDFLLLGSKPAPSVENPKYGLLVRVLGLVMHASEKDLKSVITLLAPDEKAKPAQRKA